MWTRIVASVSSMLSAGDESTTAKETNAKGGKEWKCETPLYSFGAFICKTGGSQKHNPTKLLPLLEVKSVVKT